MSFFSSISIPLEKFRINSWFRCVTQWHVPSENECHFTLTYSTVRTHANAVKLLLGNRIWNELKATLNILSVTHIWRYNYHMVTNVYIHVHGLSPEDIYEQEMRKEAGITRNRVVILQREKRKQEQETPHFYTIKTSLLSLSPCLACPPQANSTPHSFVKMCISNTTDLFLCLWNDKTQLSSLCVPLFLVTKCIKSQQQWHSLRSALINCNQYGYLWLMIH